MGRKTLQHKKRRWISKGKLTVIIVAACILVIVAVDWIERFNAPFSPAALVRTKGATGATVKIVEYVDFKCPECAKGAALIKKYLQRYPSLLRVEMRYFPNRPESVESALFAECAAEQDMFWSYHDLLFERQWQWSGKPEAREVLISMADGLGLNMEEMTSCVLKQETKATVFADKTEGELNQVQRTPTYFINGRMEVGYRGLKNRLEDLMEQ